MFIKKTTTVLVVFCVFALGHQCLGKRYHHEYHDHDYLHFGHHGLGIGQALLRKTMFRNCLLYRTGLLCKKKIPDTDLFHVFQIGQYLDTGPEDFERLDKLYKKNEKRWKSHAHHIH